ncbi:DUF2845 domain-containing protein [Legionella impletisoli]|uniref:DUF2845 domain-containing protein n=1 Tax=Legionella impletisoli TaxID=343510 RepID=A0A917JUP1_9GAMM|nr:DUF2845 domain-containing protein [Legionella impletisoli]GGI85876.1 hypothetical protein GCM10007966_13110 [Legionella impletisoli]
MTQKSLLLLVASLFPMATLAQDTIYCPAHAAYIKVGMTAEQVLAACGPPLNRQVGDRVTKRVPVTQLIYNSLNSGFDSWGGTTNLYDQWSLPQGPSGVNLEVDIMNNKVIAIKFNGSSSNAISMCSGGSFEIGDDQSQVFQACGSPSTTNNTYINQPVPTNQKPEVWVYQNDKFQQPFSLTIINGKLESISQ